MASITQTHIDIYYIDGDGIEHPLPYAFMQAGSLNPRFGWRLPEGCRSQRSFIFELRTAKPKVHSISFNGETYEYDECLYWYSGAQETSATEYKCEMAASTHGGASYDITLVGLGDKWQGLCEVRLSIVDENGSTFCTHDTTSDEYSFEKTVQYDSDGRTAIGVVPNPRYLKWGTRDDGCYFCCNEGICIGMKKENGLVVFNGGSDPDSDAIERIVQVSDTPLFGEGLYSGKLHELGGSDTADGRFSVSFGRKDGGGLNLEYDKMYYCRARSFDGFDYSDWCDVNAFMMVYGTRPKCYINSVSVPFEEDAFGTRTPLERPDGEVVVNIRVEDEDSEYVGACLLFSMRVDSLAGMPSSLNGLVSINTSSAGFAAYGEESAGKMFRAVTKGSLMRIPTNRNIDVTWLSAAGTMEWLARGSRMTSVHLYLMAFDDKMLQGNFETFPTDIAWNATPPRQSIGYNGGNVLSKNVDGGFDIDNRASGDGGAPSMQSQKFRIHGELQRMLTFPVLPDTMQRTLITSVDLGESSGSAGGMPGLEQETGCVGYSDGTCALVRVWKDSNGVTSSSSDTAKFTGLYDFMRQLEDFNERNYLQRTTQAGSFSIRNYLKYETYYSSSSLVSDSSIGCSFILGDGTPKHFNSADEGTLGSSIGTVVVIDPATGQEKTVTVYDEYGNEPYATTETHSRNGSEGFVMFCPKCDTLHILQTKVLLADGTVCDSLAEAFGEDGERFDGTPYKLLFQCPRCGTAYDMGIKYQSHLDSGVHGMLMKDRHAYWHGYNSDLRLSDDSILRQQLVLTSKRDFDLMVQEWKEQYRLDHGKMPKDEECPYTWAKLPGKSSSSSGSDEFGLSPEDALLKLDPRPEFDSYMKVVPPEALSYHENIYNDGAKLNASIELDYMHDFEQSSDSGQESSDKGDPAMTHLADQGPWWVQNRVMYQFFEGRKGMSDSDVKKGYPAMNGGEGHGSDQSNGGGAGWDDDPNSGATEYRVFGTASRTYTVFDGNGSSSGTVEIPNDGIAIVPPTTTDGTVPYSTVVNRMSCGGTAQFPIVIRRGENDMMSCIVNDEKIIEGSVLPDGIDELRVEFPYSAFQLEQNQDQNADTTNVYKYTTSYVSSEGDKFLSLIRRVLGNCFVIEGDFMPSVVYMRMKHDVNGIPVLSSLEVTGMGGIDGALNRFSIMKCVSLDGKTVSFTAYGKTDHGVAGLSEGRYRKFELLPCEGSCYESLGIVPFVAHQGERHVYGSNIYESVFPGNPDVSYNSSDGKDDYKYDQPDKYYYKTRRNTKHDIYAQESPIDNDIESFAACEVVDRDGNLRSALKYRKPSMESTGEPLFTCYRDEVDANGYHFKFTEEDYRRTGKIYIRRYHVEECNPFPMDGYGYRNWIVVPIKGSPGRYRKKKVFNSRGVPAVPRMIRVEMSSGAEPVEEIGWFASDDANADPISHERASSSSSSGQEPPVDERPVYKRKKDMEWRNSILPKTCVVFDYVDISEAMCKNPSTPAGQSPFNHVCPVNFGGGIYNDLFVNRFGLYVLGSYDLTEQQKQLENDGNPYEQEFAYVDGNGSSTTLTALLPNNWRPSVLGAKFDSVKEEASSFTVVDLSKSSSSSGAAPNEFTHGTKGIDSYKRYESAWSKREKKVVDPIKSSGYELSQRTVEQFNPSFKGMVDIWEKWGYQPANTFQQYWKEDADGLYSGKHIPASSRMVHGIYVDPATGVKGDPYASHRLVGEIMLERYIISDKTFMRVDDSYDKLPFLDYRLVGRMIYDILPYFSGYPRHEHPLYATRPEPPYPYDRQWRIGGWKVRGTGADGYSIGRSAYEEAVEASRWRKPDGTASSESSREPVPDLSPGASIDYVWDYGASEFLYLQETWNSYNRLHWSKDVGSSSYLCLFARRYEGTSWFSVRTVSSTWNESIPSPNALGGDDGAWCISHRHGETSDMIDMSENVDSNGEPLFAEGVQYVFSLFAYLPQPDGSLARSQSEDSMRFSVSRNAVSPATIIDTEYDPWTKLLTIRFRFDDELGRDYDIVGFKYAASDTVAVLDQNGNPTSQRRFIHQDNFTRPGGEGSDGTGVLIGNLHDLASNKRTTISLPDEFLITHSVQVNVSTLGITSADSLRVILESDLSVNRKGLTLPVFTVKMWANEFLKPVEEQIMSLNGYESHWKWVETYDDETDSVSGRWTYLEGDNAIRVIGRIQETQGSIDDISSKFEKWHAGNVKFCGGTDIDAFETWLKSSDGNWNPFYYGYFFLTYLVWHAQEGCYDDYQEFSMSHDGKQESWKARRWLELRQRESEYKSWYLRRRLFLLMSYRSNGSYSQEALEGWTREATVVGNAMAGYAKMLQSQYNDYYNTEILPLLPSSSSSSGGDDDENDDIEPTAEYARQFIEDRNLQKGFISYYARQDMYADTRFLERALVMNLMFGVTTAGIWEKPRPSAPYPTEYQAWLADQSSVVSELSVSDRYQLFLTQALNVETQVSSILSSYSEGDSVTNVPYAQAPLFHSDDDANAATISNTGRAVAMADFLQLPSGNGTTYSQKWQALNNTMSEYRKLLQSCLEQKNMLETDFRANLVRQGFFCNGFLDNQPYGAGGVNTCFRWRVETRQYEGKMDTSYDSQTNSFGSFDPRYNMYYHFQMDFHDTFDSQAGKPVNDTVFILDGMTDDCRILAGIDDSDDSAMATAVETEKGNVGTNYVPQRGDLVVDRVEGETTTADAPRGAKDLRFTATFGLPLEDLPRRDSWMEPPLAWRQAWKDKDDLMTAVDEPNTTAPETEKAIRDIDFKSTYYWRVSPYNLVERPVFETMLGGMSISQDGQYAVFECLFHSDGITACRNPSSQSSNYVVYGATGRRKVTSNPSSGRTVSRECPLWQPNLAAAPFSGSASQYANSNASDDDVHEKWLVKELEQRGDVQFVTDRPRRAEYVEMETTVPEGQDVQIVWYRLEPQVGSTMPSEFATEWQQFGGDSAYCMESNGTAYFLYKAVMDGEEGWFIGKAVCETESRNGSWLYRSMEPDLASVSHFYGRDGSDEVVSMIPLDEDRQVVSTTTDTVSIPQVYFIDDNIGNFDTKWVPQGVERIKPFVIRFRDHYLLFSHKVVGTVVHGNVSRRVHAITMSRGFSSDVFGEECQCIPRYTFESVGDYVRDSVVVDQRTVEREAVSIENPCVVPVGGGMYRMYFNAVFHDGSVFYSRVFKADTRDFDAWFGISKVAMTENGSELVDILQPNVTVSVGYDNENDQEQEAPIPLFEMFAVQERHYESTVKTGIVKFTSTDGIEFSLSGAIQFGTEDGVYNFSSPCLLADETAGERTLYFSVESAPDATTGFVSCVIGSIHGTTDGAGNDTWNGVQLESSKIILEKGEDPFTLNYTYSTNTVETNIVEGYGRVFRGNFPSENSYSSPCVIWDYLNGCRVRRMYYNSYESPYLWHNGSLVLFDGTNGSRFVEKVVKTEYLEDSVWARGTTYSNAVQRLVVDGEGTETWTEQTGNIPLSPDGTTIRIRRYSISWNASMQQAPQKMMIWLMPVEKSIRCMAEGKWIGFDNVDSTEALLLPEQNYELGYSLERYSPSRWIVENSLTSAFNDWAQEQDEEMASELGSEGMAVEWLMWTRNYPRYLWWSRKGPGIYRYVGYEALSASSWDGKTRKEPYSSSSSSSSWWI